MKRTGQEWFSWTTSAIAAERIGDLVGVVERRVKGGLERFKELIESCGTESGAWRGEVKQDPTS